MTTLAALCCGALACAPPDPLPMPEGLIGTWTTDDPSYEGRFLRLSETTLVIGTGPGAVAYYAVNHVEREQDDYGLLYSIAYADLDGVDHHLDLYLQRETVRLKNQLHMVWKRSEG